MVGIVFYVPAFAQGNSWDELQDMGIIISEVISFLSWSWVFFAILAGKLMSNEFVYGGFMNLDTFLWQVWNIMKNFANYTIGALFLVGVIKSFFDKEGGIWFIKQKIVGFLVAGVLIQMSWFLFAAVVDIATISTSAVGSFPGAVIQENSKLQVSLAKEVVCLRSLRVKRDAKSDLANKFTSNTAQMIKCIAEWGTLSNSDQHDNYKSYLDAILPSQDTLSGPFLFLGLSIFKFQDFTSLDNIQKGNRQGLAITAGLQFVILAMFSLSLCLLFIINVVRVISLWIAIAFSPFIILVEVMKKLGKMEKFDIFKNIPWLNIGSVLKLIFAPVIFTAFLSMILIFTFSVWGLLTSKNETKWNDIKFMESATVSSVEIEDIASSTIEGLSTGFVDILIYLGVIFLIWTLIKFAVTTISEGGPAILWEITGGLMSWLEKIPGSLSILPGPNGPMSFNGAKKFMKQSSWTFKKTLGIDDESISNQINALNNRLGLDPDWRKEREANLNNDIKSTSKWSQFFSKSRGFATEMNGLSLQEEGRATKVQEYLKITDRTNQNKLPLWQAEKDLSEYFTNHQDRVKAFATEMWVTNKLPTERKDLSGYKFGRKKRTSA